MYDIFEKKIKINIKKYSDSHIFLLLITIVCILLFLFLIIKSMQMKSNAERNIEIISNKTDDIFVKETQSEVVVDNININFYDLIDKNRQEEDRLREVVINKKYLNEFEDLDSKIDELFDIDILEKNKQEEDDVKVSKNIKNVYLNKKNEDDIIDNEVQQDVKFGIKVQLGAMKTNDFAIEYKDGLISKYNNLFKDLDFFIEKVDLMEKGVFYRVKFGVFKTKMEAKNFCNKYIKISNNKLSSCIVVDN